MRAIIINKLILAVLTVAFLLSPFVHAQIQTKGALDIDGDGQELPLTDGLLILRYLADFKGSSLVTNAVNPDGTRTSPEAIIEYLDERKFVLDVDGDGEYLSLVDGLLILRYMQGIRGLNLVKGLLHSKSLRKTYTEVEAYLDNISGEFFDFRFVYGGNVDPELKEISVEIGDYLSKYLKDSGPIDNVVHEGRRYNVDDLLIIMEVDTIDGQAGTLANTSLLDVRDDTLIPSMAKVTFDSADLEVLRNDNSFYLRRVMMHELVHALGFSSGLLRFLNLVSDQLAFRGRNAVEKYFEAFPREEHPDKTFLYLAARSPEQLEENPTAPPFTAHWDPEFTPFALMNPTVQQYERLTSVTIGLLEDLGYRVSYKGVADKFPWLYIPHIHTTWQMPGYIPPPAPPYSGGGSNGAFKSFASGKSSGHLFCGTCSGDYDSFVPKISGKRGSSEIEWVQLNQVEVQNKTLRKDFGHLDWNSGASSQQKLSGKGSFEFTAVSETSHLMVGMSGVNTDDHFKSIEFAFYLANNKGIYVYESGRYTKHVGRYQKGDVLSIHRLDDGSILYKKNDITVFTSQKKTQKVLVMDTSFYSNSGIIKDAKLHLQ